MLEKNLMSGKFKACADTLSQYIRIGQSFLTWLIFSAWVFIYDTKNWVLLKNTKVILWNVYLDWLHLLVKLRKAGGDSGEDQRNKTIQTAVSAWQLDLHFANREFKCNWQFAAALSIISTQHISRKSVICIKMAHFLLNSNLRPFLYPFPFTKFAS